MKFSAWLEKLNRRERILAGVVAGIVFLLFNLFLWSWLLGAIGHARADLSAKKAQRQEETIFIKEKALWAQRDEWLRQHQPALKNSGEAQTSLLDQLKERAGKYELLIENPAIGAGEIAPDHQAVFASIETKSSWPALLHFLYDVQQPESFLVFDSVNLAIDTNDATMMRGKFKVVRWYAPAQRKE